MLDIALEVRLDLPALQAGLEPLLPIRAGGGGQPLFCVHPAGGLSWCYLPLARFVDGDTPVYGLQATLPTAQDDLPTSITAMAREQMARIRSIQGNGPYFLLGWSLGGILAHEIAVELEAAGHGVDLVIMDTYPSAVGAEPGASSGVGPGSPDGTTEDATSGGTSPADLDDLVARIRQDVGPVLDGLSHE